MGGSHSVPIETSIHQFTVKDSSGKDVDLGRHKGKVLLVVNVASKCGLTESNYTQLSELYAKYRNKDFEILAFPCNQFLSQQPGTSQEAKDFACTRFKAEYPIFQKTGELMKIEYQRKVALLNKQKKRGTNPESIEKTKAAVNHLHTRYIVDMQSMDSTVHEIQRLRDDQLYPKLVELIDGMAKMWEIMYSHHDSQMKIVNDIRALDVSNTIRETSEHHHGRTVQLYDVIRKWHSQFQKLIGHQKECIQALNSWLKLNLIPIESNLKEKVSSPPRVHHPPIQVLLFSWHDYMEKLPDELAKNAIQSFSAVINTLMLLQEEEMKQKDKCEETRKEYVRKSRAFDDWNQKHSQKRAASGEDMEGENPEGGNQKDLVAERKFVVDSLKTKLDEEIEAHQRLCRQVREKSFNSLKSHLPELFRAMSDFALASSEMYKSLGLISASQNSEGN